jgi:hypothetical protein
MNSYRIPADMKENIRNINVRHDASGRYPQTAPDYPEERQILLKHVNLWTTCMHFFGTLLPEVILLMIVQVTVQVVNGLSDLVMTKREQRWIWINLVM